MPHKILIVDDEPDLEPLMRQRFRRSIRSGELEFLFAHNGVEAMQQLHEHEDIAIVLTDINMPQMDGLTLLGELETFNTQLKHDVKAVVVSAYSDMDNIRVAMNRGAFDFLIKPIDLNDVEVTITKTLDYVQQLKQGRRAEEYRVAKDVAEDNYERLKELESLRDSLIHMIVHDLRTPLTSVLAGMQILPALGEFNEGQHEFLEIAMAGAETLLGMINDLLGISKMEGGALEIVPKEVQISEIVSRALAQVRLLAKNHNVQLESSEMGHLPHLHVDPEMLTRILVNLLGNAIKFTPNGGEVRLEAQTEPPSDSMPQGGVRFAVHDNGRGIPPDAFTRIFDKFGQVEGGSGVRTSTGLGLTFCKLAVEAHQGHIWVESELEKGSTFSFVLPGG